MNKTITEKIEEIQLRTTQSHPNAGEIVVRVKDVVALFQQEMEEAKRDAVEAERRRWLKEINDLPTVLELHLKINDKAQELIKRNEAISIMQEAVKDNAK
jgi:hypothetical protein